MREDTIYGFIESLRGELIVSVQAYPGELMRHLETMVQIARAAQTGGVVAVRCRGLTGIPAIKGRVEVPVIGPRKEGHEGVYITPSLRHAHACIMVDCDIVTIDATSRPRLNRRTFTETCQIPHEESVLAMADCGSFEDAKVAYEAGADIISTTLAECTGDRGKSVGPDLELLKKIVAAYPGATVICEGRIHMPQDAVEAMNTGTLAVIVGTGVVHPTSITTWFKDAVEKH